MNVGRHVSRLGTSVARSQPKHVRRSSSTVKGTEFAVHGEVEQVPQSSIDLKRTWGRFSKSLDCPLLEWSNTASGRPVKAFLVKNPTNPMSQHYAAKVAEYLQNKHGVKVFVEPSSAKDLPGLQTVTLGTAALVQSGKPFVQDDDIDFAVVIGGDGTMLHLQSLFPYKVPHVLGLFCGSLGFLTPFAPETFEKHIDDIVNGRLRYTMRDRLCYKVTNANRMESSISYRVLNEIVMSRTERLKGVNAIECKIDDEYLCTFQGDGLILSSATGSTAYSLAAGGSLVHPLVNAMILSPLCSMTLATRPLVLPGESSIDLTVLSERVQLEGLYNLILMTGDRLTVRLSNHPVPTMTRDNTMRDWIQDLRGRLKYEQQVRKPPTLPESAQASMSLACAQSLRDPSSVIPGDIFVGPRR